MQRLNPDKNEVTLTKDALRLLNLYKNSELKLLNLIKQLDDYKELINIYTQIISSSKFNQDLKNITYKTVEDLVNHNVLIFSEDADYLKVNQKTYQGEIRTLYLEEKIGDPVHANIEEMFAECSECDEKLPFPDTTCRNKVVLKLYELPEQIRKFIGNRTGEKNRN